MRVLHKIAKLMITALVSIFLALGQTFVAQTLSPGEVRLTSRPYVPQSPIRVQTRLVELEVVVRDNRGRPVPGLTKEDFTLYDSHKIRDITSFSIDSSNAPLNVPVSVSPKLAIMQTESPIPRTASASPSPVQTVSNGRWIALLIDDINTPTGDLMRSKIAATRFIKEASASGDHIALFTTSGAPTLNFTSDTVAILAAIVLVQSHLRISPNGLSLCPRITAYEAYRIVSDDPTVMQAKIQIGRASCRERV
jgi:VWFA-related protein